MKDTYTHTRDLFTHLSSLNDRYIQPRLFIYIAGVLNPAPEALYVLNDFHFSLLCILD